MENIVPGILQRLSAADIIRMAGLNAAALGQEYCRTGAVSATRREGTKLFATVNPPVSASLLSEEDQEADPAPCTTEVEITSSSSWPHHCSCEAQGSLLCPHAAALLYQWLAHPEQFVPLAEPAPPTPPQADSEATEKREVPKKETAGEVSISAKSPRPLIPARPVVLPADPASPHSTLEILAQLGLSELRSIAREYDLASNGLNKQQLAEALVEVLAQSVTVRRLATTLAKSQRQLLAAITLAGGLVSDDDLRGLFERFSLGQPQHLQQVLLVLQSKAFLFRTTLQSPGTARVGLSGSLLDIGWYVPLEVRSALRVTVPTTAFDTTQPLDDQGNLPFVHLATPYRLLADLLLIARALDGSAQEESDQSANAHSYDAPARLSSGTPSGDGSVSVPPPSDLPLPVTLPPLVPLPPNQLRFALRLLRQAEILYKDEAEAANLRLLTNAAQLLLGSNRDAVARDLFELWLTQPSYAELFDLQEEGLHLRCRATALNYPILRPGELEAENREARQSLLSLLAQVPLNQWVHFPSFARFVYRLNPLFLQRKQRLYASPHWWIEQDAGRPLRPLHLNDWLRTEALYLSRLLSGPLHWWGACDLATNQDGRLLAFRLTPITAWLLSSSPVTAETTAPDYRMLFTSLEIVDTEEMLVPCDAQHWPIIELLETFAQADGVQAGRLRYRLTPSALGEALSRGQRPAPLLDLLRSFATARSAGPLPLMVQQLERWIASYGRIRIYTGVALLETIDTVVMRELSATTTLNTQVVQTLNPTLHILKKSGMTQIIEDLKRRGQSPLLHDEDIYGAE